MAKNIKTEIQNLKKSEIVQTQEAIKRLIDLKALKEKNKLDNDLEHELALLLSQYSQYEKKTSSELQLILKDLQKPAVVVLKSDTCLDLIYKDYEEKFKKKPDEKDGKTTLNFPSQLEAINFFKEQAEKNRSFIVVDAATNKVMAYSSGDGKLYHSDGKAFKQGDKMEPSTINADDFTIPVPTKSAKP